MERENVIIIEYKAIKNKLLIIIIINNKRRTNVHRYVLFVIVCYVLRMSKVNET